MTKVAIIIPLKNKAEVIVKTLENIQEITNGENNIWLIDDYSEDSSYRKADKYIKSNKLSNIKLLKNTGSAGKFSAIQFALSKCKESEYVFLLDADSIIDIKNQYFSDLLSNMIENKYDALAFPVFPLVTNKPIQKLQHLEYSIITKGLRKFIETVTCISGAGSLWKRSSLISVMKEHSGEFVGDDLEATIIAYKNSYNISYTEKVEIFTDTPNHWSKLAYQRLFSWEVGFWRCSLNLIYKDSWRKYFFSKTADAAHYRSIFITDVLMHIAKVVGFIILTILIFQYKANEKSPVDVIGSQTFNIWLGFASLGFVSINYWWSGKLELLKRLKLNIWTLLYISIPVITLYTYASVSKYILRNIPDAENLRYSKTYVDFLQYLGEKTPVLLATVIWITISFYFIRPYWYKFKFSVLIFPIYQMLLLAPVRTISLVIFIKNSRIWGRVKSFFRIVRTK